jgi:GNAT superfamily N-acetyltransferase
MDIIKRMKFMKIELTTAPTNQDIDFLTKKINDETPEFGKASTFGFFAKDENGEIIAGCNGSVIYGSIYTDQLWVHSAYRRKGIAKMLMDKIHEYGLDLGCYMATVITMSFQGAIKLYEQLGYECDFERHGYYNGASIIFFKKIL